MEIRPALPNGRTLVVAPHGAGVPLSDGSTGAWRAFVVGDEANEALGAPLVFTLMCLLGEHPTAAPPRWLADLAAEIELATRQN
jgi:hypothetical protein